jgi:hypothetical protein
MVVEAGRYPSLFAGLIDEVAYYPRVLSTARIRAHFRAGAFSSAAVPAIGEWGLIGLIAFLGLFGVYRLRQRRI